MGFGKLCQAVTARLISNQGLVDIFRNFAWLSIDRVIQLVVGLWITAWMARYLGPEQFGIWNYAFAFVALIGAFSSLGLDTIVMRDVVQRPALKNQILGSAFVIKIISSVAALLLCVLLAHLLPLKNQLVKFMISVMGLSFLVQAFDVIDFYFKSQMRSQYVVFARNAAFLALALVKIGLILRGAPVGAFAWAFVLEAILAAILLIACYRARSGNLAEWKIERRVTFNLLKSGWPFFWAYISSILYLRIDQVMIGQLLGERSVGIYSVAMRIYDIPFSMLVLLTSATFPKIIELYDRDKELFFKRYAQVTTLYTIASLLLLAVFFCLGKTAISLLFGPAYLEAYPALLVLSFGLIFVYNGMLRSSYLSVSHNEKLILTTSLFSAALNIVLNYFLIRAYGIVGSAIATLVTHFVALFLSNYFFEATKRISLIQLEAFYKFKF